MRGRAILLSVPREFALPLAFTFTPQVCLQSTVSNTSVDFNTLELWTLPHTDSTAMGVYFNNGAAIKVEGLPSKCLSG